LPQAKNLWIFACDDWLSRLGKMKVNFPFALGLAPIASVRL
jgi:hypothetical protein